MWRSRQVQDDSIDGAFPFDLAWPLAFAFFGAVTIGFTRSSHAG